MFDPSVFWAAFAAVGMLRFAQVDGIDEPVQVGFVCPDNVDLGGAVTAADYQIEYQSADLPDLARESVLTIDGIRYCVIRPPRRREDGFFSVADLKVAT